MKRNWLMVFIIVMLVTLSCRLPFSQRTDSADQPVISDQDIPGEEMMEADFYDEGVYLVSPEGVTVVISPGGLDPSGTPEQISITALPGEQISLPEGLDQVGEVYDIRAGSDVLLEPAMLSLPIPAEVPHEEIIGLTTYSEEQGSWVLVPSFVDSEAGMVTTTVTGFSGWSIASIGRISMHCSLYHVGPQCYAQERGPWIEVTNLHILNRGINPPISGARYGNYTTNYGVCIRGYELDDPSAAQSWRHLQDWCLTVSDYASSRTGRVSTMRWLLPAGRYQLEEYASASERNPGGPAYVPVHGLNYRPLAIVELREGQTARFVNSGDFTGWLGWGVARPELASEEVIEEEETSIMGVLPQKVICEGTRTSTDNKYESECKFTTPIKFEFWNVGSLGGDEYQKVIFEDITFTYGGLTCEIVDEEEKRITYGSFTGGPNGIITVTPGEIEFVYELNNGLSIEWTWIRDELDFVRVDYCTIQNPEAFDGWTGP